MDDQQNPAKTAQDRRDVASAAQAAHDAAVLRNASRPLPPLSAEALRKWFTPGGVGEGRTTGEG